MILSFAVENFFGIGHRQEIDFISTAKNDYPETTYTIAKSAMRVNRSLCLIGPNGSGKTNLLKSLFVLNRTAQDADLSKYIESFKLSKKWKDKPTNFEILLFSEKRNEFYEYELSLNGENVVRESLISRENNLRSKRVKIFERTNNKLTFNSKLKVDSQLIQNTLGDNVTLLFLGRGMNIPALKETHELITSIFYFTPDLITSMLPDLVSMLYKKLEEDEVKLRTRERINNEILTKAVNIIHSFGIKLKDLKMIKSENNTYSLVFYPITVDVETSYTLEQAEKFFSEGSFNTIMLIILIGFFSQGNHTLLLDEFDSTIHHKLSVAIIDFIRDKHIGHNSQLVMSTHNILLLDHKFRRDSIYTVQKDNNLETLVNRISSFPIRKDAKISQKYMSDEFGALPKIMTETLNDSENTEKNSEEEQ